MHEASVKQVLHQLGRPIQIVKVRQSYALSGDDVINYHEDGGSMLLKDTQDYTVKDYTQFLQQVVCDDVLLTQESLVDKNVPF